MSVITYVTMSSSSTDAAITTKTPAETPQNTPGEISVVMSDVEPTQDSETVSDADEEGYGTTSSDISGQENGDPPIMVCICIRSHCKTEGDRVHIIIITVVYNFHDTDWMVSEERKTRISPTLLYPDCRWKTLFSKE